MNRNTLDSEINLINIAINSNPCVPPWLMTPPGFQLSLDIHGGKSDVSPTVFQGKFDELLSQFDVYTSTITDISKIGEALGAASIMAFQVFKKRLPNNLSVFSKETRKILLALDIWYISLPAVSSCSFLSTNS